MVSASASTTQQEWCQSVLLLWPCQEHCPGSNTSSTPASPFSPDGWTHPSTEPRGSLVRGREKEDLRWERPRLCVVPLVVCILRCAVAKWLPCLTGCSTHVPYSFPAASLLLSCELRNHCRCGKLERKDVLSWPSEWQLASFNWPLVCS